MNAPAKQEVSKQSRNGKLPVALLAGVSVEINGQEVTVKGKRGSLTRTFRPEVVVSQENGQVLVRPAPGAGQAGLQYQGLSRALVAIAISSAWTRWSSVSSGWKAQARTLPSRTATGWPSQLASTSTPGP